MDLEQHKMNGEDNYGSNEMDFVQEADQWTEALPNQVHAFYFIKYRPHKDPKVMRNVAHANFEIKRKGEEIDHLNEALKTIEVKHNSIRNILHVNSFWENYYGMVADSKSKELARIQDFLRKDAKNNRMKLHLFEEDELKSIKTLNHHVQYKKMSAYEEKKLMKKIKEIEATRETIMANVYLEAKQNQEKEEKENQRLFNKIVDAPVKVWVKSQAKSIKIMKEMQLERMEKVKRLRKDLNALRTEIRLLKERINTANSKMEKAHEVLLKAEKFRLEARTKHIQCLLHSTVSALHEVKTADSMYLPVLSILTVSLVHFGMASRLMLATLNEARTLAKEEYIDALEELSKNEMANFFLQWSNNKLFKDDYERRVFQSQESRGLSRDGRTKNSD